MTNLALGRNFLAEIGTGLLLDCLNHKTTLSVTEILSLTQTFRPLLKMH